MLNFIHAGVQRGHYNLTLFLRFPRCKVLICHNYVGHQNIRKHTENKLLVYNVTCRRQHHLVRGVRWCLMKHVYSKTDWMCRTFVLKHFLPDSPSLYIRLIYQFVLMFYPMLCLYVCVIQMYVRHVVSQPNCTTSGNFVLILLNSERFWRSEKEATHCLTLKVKWLMDRDKYMILLPQFTEIVAFLQRSWIAELLPSV